MNKTATLFDSMKLPQGAVTDRFGAFRDFALPGQVDPETKRVGWYPGCGYRPIHYGMDFSFRQDPQLFAPCNGQCRFVKAQQMIVFVPHHDDGSPAHDAVIYYRHVLAGSGFDDGGWHEVSAASIIATPDIDHTAFPHLHMEIAVTMDVYGDLVESGDVSRDVVTLDYIGRRGEIRRMSAYDVITAVNSQIDTDGISMIEVDAIFRKELPAYKRTEYSYLGRDNVVLVNPEAVIG